MKKLILIGLLLLPACAFAGGPKYQFDDPLLNDELTNIYHDIQFPIITYAKVSSETVTSLTVSTVTLTGYASWPGWMVIQSTHCVSATDVSFGASQTYATTNLTCSITPKLATSHIRVRAVHYVKCDNPGTSTQVAVKIQLLNGVSALQQWIAPVGVLDNTAAHNILYGTAFLNYEDSPNSVAQQTYSTQAANWQGAGAVSIIGSSGGPSDMILEEVSK